MSKRERKPCDFCLGMTMPHSKDKGLRPFTLPDNGEVFHAACIGTQLDILSEARVDLENIRHEIHLIRKERGEMLTQLSQLSNNASAICTIAVNIVSKELKSDAVFIDRVKAMSTGQTYSHPSPETCPTNPQEPSPSECSPRSTANPAHSASSKSAHSPDGPH